MFCKKIVLTYCAKFTGKRNLIKKETLAQAFSCEFYEISKNTFSYKTPLVAGSEHNLYLTLFIAKLQVILVKLKLILFTELHYQLMNIS